MARHSDSDSMDHDNVMVVGDLVAYSTPEVALYVSNLHMNAVKEGQR